jgi:peptidoglycan/xylan/chitin deacetylase (PgdA/CDA1 family)
MWRKNSPELMAAFNGSLPGFVWQPPSHATLQGIPVFGYHCVEAEVFRADLEFLVRNDYRTLHPEELVARMRGEVAIGEREVMVTFDDGPRNFAAVALPLIEEFGLKAVAFIAPGLLAEHYGEYQDSPYRPMTWGEVRRAHSSGLVSIQSHTFESRYVPQWPKPAALAGVDPRIEAYLRSREPLPLEDDVRRARQMIESQCQGACVRHLCFPMYHSTAQAIEILIRNGYLGLYCGLLPGRPTAMLGQSPLQIPRLLGEFLRRLPGEGRMSLAGVFRLRGRSVRLGRAMRRHWRGSP